MNEAQKKEVLIAQLKVAQFTIETIGNLATLGRPTPVEASSLPMETLHHCRSLLSDLLSQLPEPPDNSRKITLRRGLEQVGHSIREAVSVLQNSDDPNCAHDDVSAALDILDHVTRTLSIIKGSQK